MAPRSAKSLRTPLPNPPTIPNVSLPPPLPSLKPRLPSSSSLNLLRPPVFPPKSSYLPSAISLKTPPLRLLPPTSSSSDPRIYSRTVQSAWSVVDWVLLFDPRKSARWVVISSSSNIDRARLRERPCWLPRDRCCRTTSTLRMRSCLASLRRLSCLKSRASEYTFPQPLAWSLPFEIRQ